MREVAAKAKRDSDKLRREAKEAGEWEERKEAEDGSMRGQFTGEEDVHEFEIVSVGELRKIIYRIVAVITL